MLTKIRTTLPKVQAEFVDRSELLAGSSAPIVVLHAPAGYGKTQLLAQWCAVHDAPVAYGVCSRLGETPSTLLELLYATLGIESQFQPDAPWREQADGLLEHLYSAGSVTVMLDDVHHLDSDTSQVEECGLLLSYLLDYRAPECRWVFSGRHRPQIADLEIKEMTGQVLTLNAPALSLTAGDLDKLSPGHGTLLHEMTSGWPLACTVLLKTQPDQWAEQREKLGQGLLAVATKDLDPETGQALTILGLVGTATRQELERHHLWALLEPLSSDGALVQKLHGDRLAVHPVFSEQYREDAGDQERRRALDLLEQTGRGWESLELFTSPVELAEALLRHGSRLLASGRLRLLEKLLERAAWRPQLGILRGRLRWFMGDPAGALENFSESARAALNEGQSNLAAESWRAAGQLYIDAVCPLEALSYLKKAYRVLSPAEGAQKAEILEMLAENAVNLGQTRVAQRFRSLARRWDQEKPEDLALTARLLLRSGRLAESRGAAQVAQSQEQRELSDTLLDGHRDPRLVLSYLLVLEGLAEQAGDLAATVLHEAEERDDRRTRSVALIRLAHSRLLSEKGGLDEGEREALRLYSEADSLAKTLGVEKLRAEALMGMALYHISQENTPRAYEACREGVEIAERSGDEWLASWLRLIRAVAAVEGGHPSGLDLLASSQQDFKQCRDRFGFALTDIWSTASGGASTRSLRKHFEEFPFLLQRPSLFAPDPARLTSAAQTQPVETHAHRLQVFALGPVSLLRDGQAVPAKAFKRKKARELLVLLLAAPDTYFHREELAEQLWPDASQKAALRDFRVALHALSDALEPERAKNTTAFCIDRQEERYRLESHKMDLDTHRFHTLVEDEHPESWEKAVRLFRGRFCEDYPYLETLVPVRRRYDELYLQAAEKLAGHYLGQDRFSAAAELAQKMLDLDTTWEPAYRLLMRCQHELGHEHLLPRTFTRCLETLEEELGVEPSDETFELARELLGDQLATLL